jgi:hypothetical protein
LDFFGKVLKVFKKFRSLKYPVFEANKAVSIGFYSSPTTIEHLCPLFNRDNSLNIV